MAISFYSSIEIEELDEAFTEEPLQFLDLLASLKDGAEFVEDCAMAHDLSAGHMAIPAFLRSLADALDAVSQEEYEA